MAYYGQYGKESDAPFYLSVIAFLSLDAASIYGYTQGVFHSDPQEIIQEITQFKKCEINNRSFTRVGYDDEGDEYDYSVSLPVLECELTDKQKSTPEAFAQAEESKEDLINKVWRLPSKIHEEVQVELIKYNAKKFPEETVGSIAENAKHFTNCDVVKVEDKNAMRCSLSTVQMESEDTVDTLRHSLAVMNVQVPQLNEQSISKLKEKIQKIKEDNAAFIQASGNTMSFK